MNWHPHITVAAVVERDNHFLMVKEKDAHGNFVINQPAGHLESNESLTEAVIRETLEETRWLIEPQHILSLNLYTAPNNTTYFRCNFLATTIDHRADAILDSDIDEVLWMTEEDLAQQSYELRSPLVMAAIKDFRGTQRFPLSLIKDNFSS